MVKGWRPLRLRGVLLVALGGIWMGACGPMPDGSSSVAVQPSMPGRVEVRTVAFGGRQRTYRLYVPSGYHAAVPTAVVIVLHGGGGTAQNTARVSGFDAEAERGGFIALYPNGVRGTDGAQNWNDGRPGIYPAINNVDDVGFIGALLDVLGAEFSIDAGRVFATGISNGGMMAYRLACDLSDRIAAIAPVAATMTAPSCEPSRAVSVLHVHGTADRYVPMAGGIGITRAAGYQLAPVRSVVEFWRAVARCATDADIAMVGTDAEPVTRETWSGCAEGVGVTLYTIEGGGHTWPGASVGAAQMPANLPAGLPSVGPTSTVVDATQLIWQFFAEHGR